MTLLTSKGAGMAYPHEIDESGVVTTKNPNANQPGAVDPVEAAAVTGRPNDPTPENTTFADRKAMTAAQAENKSVSSALRKDELIDEAARRGIAVDDSMTKQDIIDAINAG